MFDDLDRRDPGFRFRVVDEQGRLRPNMRIFVVRPSELPAPDLPFKNALEGRQYAANFSSSNTRHNGHKPAFAVALGRHGPVRRGN